METQKLQELGQNGGSLRAFCREICEEGRTKSLDNTPAAMFHDDAWASLLKPTKPIG
jgi:hypothetical protein